MLNFHLIKGNILEMFDTSVLSFFIGTTYFGCVFGDSGLYFALKDNQIDVFS